MSSARDINAGVPIAHRRVSISQNLSTSPTATFQSPPASFPASFGTGLPPRKSVPKVLKPFNTQDIKILLLENVNQTGRDILTGQGYQVEALKTSLPEDQLIEKIR
jgi:D-3-phosphoglycerate dehydrogenase